MKLSAEQQRVVDAPAQASLTLLAVAGAGKTHTLVERVARLINLGALPEQLLFLTFSRAAAEVLYGRLYDRFLPTKVTWQVRTIHSLVLEEMGKPVILQSNEVNLILKSLQRRWGIGERKLAQNLLKSRSGPATSVERRTWSRFESKRQAICRQYGELRITFDELLTLALERWERDPTSLEPLRARYSHVFVDEYQDVNEVQHEIITLLARGKPLTVVGDANQAIFTFQGSHPKYLQELTEPPALVFRLNHNYRCPAPHVLYAESLTGGHPFVPTKGFEGEFAIHEVTNSTNATALLLELLRKFITLKQEDVMVARPGEQSTNQVAILCRTNAEIRQLAQTLRQHGFDIETTLREEEDFNADLFCRHYLKPVLQTLMGERRLLRRLPLRTDNILSASYGSIDHSDHAALDTGWRTYREPAVIAEFCQSRGARRLLASWEELTEIAQQDLPGLPQRLARHFGTAEDLTTANRLCNVATSPADVLQQLNVSKLSSSVLLSTVHKAKGKEWREVILFDGASTMDPLRPEPSLILDDDQLRLAYVAWTRSLRNLTAISATGGHGLFGRTDNIHYYYLKRLQNLFDPDKNNPTIPPDLVDLYNEMPSLRQWFVESAPRLLPQRYPAIASLLALAEVPPPKIQSVGVPPENLVRPVKRIPLRGKLTKV